MKMIKKIDNGWLRLIVMVLAGINSIAMMMGVELIPFSNEQVVTGLSIGALILSELWNHWKNNDWTESAKQASKWLKSAKQQEKGRS